VRAAGATSATPGAKNQKGELKNEQEQKALEALLEYSRHYEQHWGRKPDGAGFPLHVGHANQHSGNSTDYSQMV
jgi:hypothetical protein